MQSLQKELRFKLSTPTGELRRLRFSVVPSWVEFQTFLEKTLFPGRAFADIFTVQYVDEEGDRISVGSQQEWQEALDILVGRGEQAGLLKLYVVDKNQQHEPSASLPTLDGLKTAVEGFFTQIPNWIEVMSQTVQKVHADARQQPQQEPCQVAPRRVNSFRRRCFWFNRLHRIGYLSLVKKNLDHAKQCFDEIIQHRPQDSVALYNLACVHSLLSANKDGTEREEEQLKALEFLRQSVSCGFSDLEHLVSDPDLEALTNHTSYVELVASLKNQAAPHTTQQDTASTTPKEQINDNSKPRYNKQTEPELTAQTLEPKATIQDLSEFENELKSLEEMGFSDREGNLVLLRRKRGNIGRVLAHLLD